MSKPKVVSFVIVSVFLSAVAFIANHRSLTAAPPDNSMAGGVPDAIRALQARVRALEAKPSGVSGGTIIDILPAIQRGPAPFGVPENFPTFQFNMSGFVVIDTSLIPFRKLKILADSVTAQNATLELRLVNITTGKVLLTTTISSSQNSFEFGPVPLDEGKFTYDLQSRLVFPSSGQVSIKNATIYLLP